MRPLEGARIVVTRATHQAEDLALPLRELGAEVLLLPVIGIAPPGDPLPLRQAATHANEYDWIIFTSANAITAFTAQLSKPAGDSLPRVATVGAATRELAEQYGFKVSMTPAKYVAESLIEVFRDEELARRRILIPSAAVTRDVVATELRRQGAHVEVVEAYRNIIPSEAAERAPLIFRDPYPDWVTFASSSAVDNLVSLAGTEAVARTKIATIGPVTSDSVRKHGLNVTTEAKEHTVEGLVKAILARH